jgi:hypothetical protein
MQKRTATRRQDAAPTDTARAEARTLQLRLAKRARREPDRRNNRVAAQVTLPAPLAERFAFARRQPGFESRLAAFLDGEAIHTADYPKLQLLCWNRRDAYVSAADAWSLYESNWRFVETEKLDDRERALIRGLDRAFGGGLLRA